MTTAASGNGGFTPEVQVAIARVREDVAALHAELVRSGLVVWTGGNVSGRVPGADLFVIKPSGVEYDELTPDMLVVMDLNGNQVEGDLNPSSDTKTHLELYKAFPALGGVVHTHSTHAVAWAQARRDIPAFGTTHADYFYGPVPCARELTPEEIEKYKPVKPSLLRPAFCAPAMAPLPGARMPPRLFTTPLCWKKWPRWPC
mgnify:CR=1 FL=1